MSDNAGIDDLLGLGDEPRAEPGRERRPRSRAGWVIRNIVLVIAATLVTLGILRAAGIRISVLIVIAAFVALRLLMLAVAQVAPPPLPRARTSAATEESGDYRWAGTDALRAAVRRWEQMLEWSHSDGDRFSRTVLPVLAELTDERLHRRHGITRASDPVRARELLGEPLSRLLDEPGRKPPRPRELQAYVEVLEKL
jgi:hypothetical protein